MILPVGWDYETEKLGPQNLQPEPVCISACAYSENDDHDVFLFGRREEDQRQGLLETLLKASEDQPEVVVAHYLAFDLAVAAKERPDLIPDIFQGLLSGRLHCTVIREKLLNLTEFGEVDYVLTHSGNKRSDYGLAPALKSYTGIDISEQKTEDSWRTNYDILIDTPVDEWPEEARDYAAFDAVWCCTVWVCQEKRRERLIEETGHDPFAVLSLQCLTDFCLYLMSSQGCAIDGERLMEIKGLLGQELEEENLHCMIEEGVLRPAVPPRPYVNGAKNKDGTPKMTAGKNSSINKTRLKEIIEEVCEKNGIEVKKTEPSKTFPEGTTCTDSGFIAEISHLHPVLVEYAHRQKLNDLLTKQVNRLMWDDEPAEVVHPNFDVLKNSGRTSSRGSKLYPSLNIQNVDPKVRECFVARPGYKIVSVDYSQMELVTLAQTCLNLFGYSVLADKINAGIDFHAYLGAQIAKHSDEGFAEVASDDPDLCYNMFVSIGKGGWETCSFITEDSPGGGSHEKWYKHYRTLAKPTDLGYPGGLGPDTFIVYAKSTFGLEIDRDTASDLRDIWKQTLPEMVDYFANINNNRIDHRWSTDDRTKYAYTSPLGMYRPNCDYCAAANGEGLQTPGAEGAKLGLCLVLMACYDPTQESILYGVCFPFAFVHDELLVELPDDEHLEERIQAIRSLMEQGMKVITPDVEIGSSFAVMSRWDKEAQEKRNSSGKLISWN